MKFRYFLFLGLLMPFLTKAQSNYKQGYVILSKGDTVRGFIDYRGWDSNPTSITFKAITADAKPQKLTKNEISYFCVNGIAEYKQYKCTISQDETNTLRLSSGRDTTTKLDTVFLRILQKGKFLALYTYTDAIKTRLYIGETPGYTPIELVYRIFDDTGNLPGKQGNTVIENTFLKQLFALANKYNALDDGIIQKLNNASYNEEYILEIVSDINKFSKDRQNKARVKPDYNFFVSAAANIVETSTFSDSQFVVGGGTTSYTSILPAISAGISITPNPNTEKIEFRLKILYTGANFSDSYTAKVSPYVPLKASFTQNEFSITPEVIYHFYNNRNFKAYLGFGFAFRHFFYSNPYFGSQNPGVSDNGIGETDPYLFINNGDSFVFKAGIKVYKKWELFFNYLTSTPTTPGGYFEFNNNSKQIGLLYLFGK